MAELTLGVLAEDDNDCEVIKVLIRRIFEARGVKPGAWRLKKGHDKGCANLRRKTERWLVDLAREGCTAAVVLHDLDRNPLNGSLNDEAVLQHRLEAIPVPRGFERLICIPVEEIEAWFFSSERALEKACGKPQKAHQSPHLIAKPKETLSKLSRDASKKPRYSENENHKLAEVLELAECRKKCAAFAGLYSFVEALAPS
jgi:uncharacterized protein DUF4276